MRADLIGPRPLSRPKPLVKGSPEWYAPFQTDEISKSDPFGMLLCDVVAKSIYGDQLCKAEGTQVASPKAMQAAAIGSAPTQLTSASDVGRAETQRAAVPSVHSQKTVVGTSGEIPDFSSRSSVSSPGHKMAMAQGHLEHHANEYHRNMQMAGDSTADPKARAQASANAAEHQRLGTNAQKVVNLHASNGVQATEKHHADLVNHYEANKQNPAYAGGVMHPLQPSGNTLRSVHNPKSGDWDKHYGVNPEVAFAVSEKKPVQPVTPKVTATSEQGTGVISRGKLTGGRGGVPKTQVSQGGKTEISPVQPTVITSGEGAKMEGARKGIDLSMALARLSKAIEGQVGVSEQIHPSEASGMKLWGREPKKNVHVEAAKHWIQGNHAEFQKMQKEHGADPQQHHMKEAAKQLGYKTASLDAVVEKAMSEMSKSVSPYQRKKLQESAANSLFHHHLAKIRGNEEEATQHLDQATTASKQAGSGPTRGMMQSHVNIHKEDVGHAEKVSRGPGAGTSSGKLLGNMATENLQAAQQAAKHPLVGSKHEVEKSLRVDLIDIRKPLRPAKI